MSVRILLLAGAFFLAAAAGALNAQESKSARGPMIPRTVEKGDSGRKNGRPTYETHV